MTSDSSPRVTPLRALLTVGGDLALAYVVAIALGIVLAFGLGHGAQALLQQRRAHSVDLGSANGPEAEALLAACREAAPDTGWGAEEADGKVWITSEGGTDELPPELESRWTGSVRIESGFAVMWNETFRDPAALAQRLRPMLPAMLIATSLALLFVGIRARRVRLRRSSAVAQPRSPSVPRPRASSVARPGAARVVAAGVAAGALILGIVAGLDGLLSAAGWKQQEQPWLRAAVEAGGPTLLLTSLGVVLLAPLGEELFFRGYVFPYLQRHGGRVLAYAGSTVLFAVGHLNPAALPSYLVYGALLAALRDRTRSTVPCVAAHVVVNGSALALQVGA